MSNTFARKRALALLSAVSISAISTSAPAVAQDVETVSDQDFDLVDDRSDVVVVTGSRIAKPDYAYSNPVVSLDSSAIQYSGQTNVTDLLT